MERIYFDSAASTEVDDRVIEAMVKSLKTNHGNPSSTHSFGQEGKVEIEQVRKDIAKRLKVDSSEIIFTSCGTEANNMILRSCVSDLGVTRIISSELEHKSVYGTIKSVKEKNAELEVVYLPVKNKKGELDYDKLEVLLQDQSKKTLVSLMHSNNEIGNLIDLKSIAELCKKHNVLFHSDTVQTMAHLDLDFSDVPLDFACASAHKFHGPKGIGFAFIRKGTGIKSLITGGAQEKGIRAGTENTQGIVGMGVAFNLALNELEERRKHITSLKEYAIEKLKDNFSDIKINGNGEDIEGSMFTLVSVLIPKPSSLVSFQLDMNGIAVSQGSACASGAVKGSNTMSLIYTPEELKDTTTLRISFSHLNSEQEIDKLVTVLQRFV